MRFLDANIFIYAFYKPKGRLTEKQKFMKEKAKEIVRKLIEGKEKFITTVVHISEVANILEKALSIEALNSILTTLYSLENLKIVGITEEEYLIAIELMKKYKVDVNDCLAIYIMKKEGIKEIFSFDKDFDKIEEIRRLP